MKRALKQNKRTRGFTLVEMIGVLAVVAILTAMLIPKVFESINTARINAAASAINTVKSALATHYGKYGSFVDSTGALFIPATVDLDPDAQNFDTAVLLTDGLLDKRFTVKIGDQLPTNLIRVRQIVAAALATDIDEASANYDFDGVATDVDTNDGAMVVEAVITGVTAADARALKELIDGSDITGVAILPDLGDAATLGRVKYPAIAPGTGGTVLVYLNHR